MLKYSLVLLLLVLIITPLYPIYAKDASTGAYPSAKISPRPIRAVDKLAAEQNLRPILKLETREEKLASMTAMLKERLAKFKDKKKALVVQRVNDNLASISASRSAQMSENLTRLSTILDKVDEKIVTAENTGKDMTSPKSAVSNARTAVAAAQSAVDAQKLKDYTITATSEAKVREEAMTARNNLHTDLNSVHELIVNARQLVAKAISETVSQIKGGTNGSN